MSKVNTDLASGHFQNYWVVQSILDCGYHWQYNELIIKLRWNSETMYNRKYCKIPVYVPCGKVLVKYYGGMCDPRKNGKSETILSKVWLSELLQMR